MSARRKAARAAALAILVAGSTAAFAETMPPGPANGASPISPAKGSDVASHPYVGMWVTADGRVRHELLPNGRYDETRGTRQSAYQGRYEVKGDHIDYWDDTGFTADGRFVDLDTLHHGGMVLRRVK